MKKFYYDTLLDEDNICNLVKERRSIEVGIKKKSKMVIYGHRNFGKTSLVKNVILEKFAAQNKKNFVFFADLMEVKTLDSIDQRVIKGFETAFARSFPAKNFMDGVKEFLGALRPEISIDSNTGAPSLSLASKFHNKNRSCEEIFETIIKISKERNSIIVLDEFQDIAFVDEAQGLFRRVFQEIKNIPLIVMGSKRHILANILAKPSAPLAMFGEDVEFNPIAYDEYHSYIMDRFKEEKLALSLDDSKYLQNTALRIPEAINIICAEIMDTNHDKKIKREEINLAIASAVERRRSRYEEYLSLFSENEESILVSLAKMELVKHPNSAEFLKNVRPTSRIVGGIVKNLHDRSVIDKKEEGYYISDPLLAFYLKRYR